MIGFRDFSKRYEDAICSVANPHEPSYHVYLAWCALLEEIIGVSLKQGTLNHLGNEWDTLTGEQREQVLFGAAMLFTAKGN